VEEYRAVRLLRASIAGEASARGEQARKLGHQARDRIKRLDVRGGSQLVIDQVMKNASCHDDKMEAYCKAVWALEDKFYGIELNHVSRRYNEEADELAKIASG
jgi:hypothetical protein